MVKSGEERGSERRRSVKLPLIKVYVKMLKTCQRWTVLENSRVQPRRDTRRVLGES